MSLPLKIHGWLEDEISFKGMAYFQGRTVSLPDSVWLVISKAPLKYKQRQQKPCDIPLPDPMYAIFPFIYNQM